MKIAAATARPARRSARLERSANATPSGMNTIRFVRASLELLARWHARYGDALLSGRLV
jgi:hypothetical protein